MTKIDEFEGKLTRPRLVSFVAGERKGFGLVDDHGLMDLSVDGRSGFLTMKAVIEAGALGKIADLAGKWGIDFHHGDFTHDLPLPDAGKIICVGVNYPDRNAEYKDGKEAPANPSLFPRFGQSFVGHGQEIIRPFVSPQFDYEGEVVVVIGKSGRHIDQNKALDHIAALTLCNEGTVRDWVRHAKFNVTQGKNFDRSGAIGPWIIPFEDESQIADIRLTTRVNGELRQDDRTSRMIFDFRFLISYISTFTTLFPGDVIVTGTPTGAGARFDPPKFLLAGDVIEVAAEGIGTLSNTVADEAKP